VRPIKYWVAVVSKEHTLWGVSGGYMQVCHGKQSPLKRMRKDDWIIVYSPKLTMDGLEKCQAFTAIGQASDEEVYPFRMSENFIPFRRNISFHNCIETSILPLINELEFIQNKKSWGFPFRFGFLEINENDFNLIVSKMIPNEI
jgi:hypothetical protein